MQPKDANTKREKYLYSIFEDVGMCMNKNHGDEPLRAYLPSRFGHGTACWLDTDDSIPIRSDSRGRYIASEPFHYGADAYARIAKISVSVPPRTSAGTNISDRS